MQGRSGGGVFNANGQLIGVCNAAVPGDNEGLYAALAVVHAELNRNDLAYVYRNPAINLEPAHRDQVADARPSAGPVMLAGATAVAEPPAMPKRMPPPADLFQQTEAHERGPAPAAGVRDEAAAGRNDDVEIVCVIRSRSNPKAQSEIIVIDKPASALLDVVRGKKAL